MVLPRYLIAVLLCACIFGAVRAASDEASRPADRRALIVIGLTSGETQAARLHTQAENLRQGFVARGFSPESIQLLSAKNGAPLRRETVLDTLKAFPSSAVESWIILLGTVAATRDSTAAFQVTGPRLNASDFAASVAELPGQKFVVVATSGGGGFLPALLKIPAVEATAATAVHGEVSEPRFATLFADALKAKPHASFSDLAIETTRRVNAFYKQNKIAQSEHPHRIDHATQKVVAITVDDSDSSASGSVASHQPNAKTAPSNVSDIVIPKPAAGLEIDRQPATQETRALLEAAHASAANLRDAALILALRAEFVVSNNFTSSERWSSRTFIRTAEALDDVATLRLSHNPPFILSQIEAARVIRPDGSQLLIDPHPLVARAADAREENKNAPSSSRAAPPVIELPEVTAGCIVELTWSLERKSENDIPEFYDEWHFAKKFPTRSLHISLTLPADERWKFFAQGFPPPTIASVEASQPQVITWSLTDIPAYEPLVGDLSFRAATPWIGASSLTSWEKFAAWFRRLAAGSDETGPEVTALAAQIARDHPGRDARLRAAYERVAALRYVAIELGVGAFRPRTPAQVWRQRYGDCKDKAGLLVAVLRELGITAELALINRFNTTFTDFPGWQFNHALVHVPAAPAEGQPHDLWLDSTDRLVPFGVIAPGDVHRPAFIFPPGEDAARFVTVTPAQELRSEWRETWKLSPTSTGNTHGGRVTLSAQGFADATLRRMFTELTPDQRLARLHELLGVSTLTIERIVVSDTFDLSTAFRIEADVTGVTPTHIAPRPPHFSAAFAAPSRTRPLAFHEGRATRYVQEVAYTPSKDASPKPAPDQERKREAAGFLFRETRRAGSRVVEISTPTGALAPADYPAVRAAWHTFLTESPPLP